MNESLPIKLENEPVVGKSIRLRFAEPEDASFILSLRLDNRRNRFVSSVSEDVKRQKEWLTAYKVREQQGTEYYFIIELLNGEAVGTVRIYDYQGDSFCWGSWLISPGAPSSVSIESALLVYEIAFYRLRFTRAHFDVRKGNERVVAFHQRFGATITHSTDLDFFFNYSRESYQEIRNKYARFLPAGQTTLTRPEAGK